MSAQRFLFIAAFLGLTVASQNAMAQSAQCHGTGNRAKWGSNAIAAFPIAAGESCFYGFPMQGEVQSSQIVQQAKHGTVTMTNSSTFQYTANAKYKGKDSFKIRATGEGPDSRGTSTVTFNVSVK